MPAAPAVSVTMSAPAKQISRQIVGACAKQHLPCLLLITHGRWNLSIRWGLLVCTQTQHEGFLYVCLRNSSVFYSSSSGISDYCISLSDLSDLDQCGNRKLPVINRTNHFQTVLPVKRGRRKMPITVCSNEVLSCFP